MLLPSALVAALWYGPVKPEMNLLLQPILNRISSIEKDGIPHKSVVLRAKLLQAVFDLPARSSATNTKQFNGEYGCFYCTDKGEVFNRARIYPPTDKHTIRTSQEMREWAAKAETSGKPQYGVKGRSILSEFIEFPSCIPIDYMHSVLEGVYKNLMKMWFDPRFHSEPYSLRRHIGSIEKLISKVKPPKEVQCLPRSIDQLAFFKASEYRAWMLFHALPILSHFLPPEFVHHLSLLVSAMHILLSDEINVKELDRADNMLRTFYETAGGLYSFNIYTSNMHSLVHTVSFVKLWGPLWVNSMFGFENLNGYLGHTFHGTRKIVSQISFQIQLSQTVPFKLAELHVSVTESSAAQAYIKKLLSKSRLNMQKIAENC